ncbi:TetR/AcrR family transcriptional regulator [Actinoplanes sp. NPDC049265]|uniref:TetR/AcrR family transcriptional regulator n=1 Tax=Actinoplanes sp. NPDC049265 TaxID=3363902 RepID=UPI0037193CE1
MTEDRRLLRGERTRAAVLDHTLRLASVEGLDGLSLARLAETLGISKSGLFAHWRSKEEIQLAVIDHARQEWIAEVSAPGLRAPRGVRRLWAVHERRMAYYESGRQPGAYFFASAYFEYNARESAVGRRLISELDDWMALLTRLAREAVEAGELRPGTDPAGLAYLTDSLGVYAAMQAPVVGAAATCGAARQSLLTHLRALATDPTILPEPT